MLLESLRDEFWKYNLLRAEIWPGPGAVGRDGRSVQESVRAEVADRDQESGDRRQGSGVRSRGQQ